MLDLKLTRPNFLIPRMVRFCEFSDSWEIFRIEGEVKVLAEKRGRCHLIVGYIRDFHKKETRVDRKHGFTL